MFFLTTYAVLNVAAGVEGFLDSPSFRPEFEVHWSLSLLGAAGCIGVMFLINWWAPLIRNPLTSSDIRRPLSRTIAYGR